MSRLARDPGPRSRQHLAADGALVLGVLATILGLAVVVPLPPWLAVAASLVLSGMIVWRFRSSNRGGPFGFANRVTLLRLNLVALMLLALWPGVPGQALYWTLVTLAGVALALDGVDGWLARHRREDSPFGASFDMAADTALLVTLTLCLARLDLVGPWVLVIGLLRPLFVLAARRWPALAGPLPPSPVRRIAGAIALALLVAGLAPPLVAIAPALAALSLAVLLGSFAHDLRLLLSARRAG